VETDIKPAIPRCMKRGTRKGCQRKPIALALDGGRNPPAGSTSAPFIPSRQIRRYSGFPVVADDAGRRY
jgi:hypothetical protein